MSELCLGQPFTISCTVEVSKAIADAVFEVDMSTLDGTYVTTSLSVDGEQPPAALSPGRHCVSLDLNVALMPGHYSIDLGLHHSGPPWTIDFVRRTLDVEVVNLSESGGDRYPFEVKRGFVRSGGRWRLSQMPAGEPGRER